MHRTIYQPQATHTRVRVTFYSFEGDGFHGTVDSFHPNFGHIISVSTNKSLGSASGNFQIQVKKPLESSGPKSWTRLWEDPEGTWVLIQWIVDGQVIDGMLGLIDEISEETRRDTGGMRSESYTIAGRDFGRVFEQTTPFINVWDHPSAAALGLVGIFNRMHHSGIMGPPGAFVRSWIEAWIGNYEGHTQPWRLPPGLGADAFYELLQLNIGCTDEEIDGFDTNPAALHPEGGKNLWAMLQEVCNGLMNELIADLAPEPATPRARFGLRPTVTLRRKPFRVHGDSQRWDALPVHKLERGEVQSRSVAKGGPAHRFNFWLLDIQGKQGIEMQSALQSQGATAGQPGSIPIWNAASIERHGLRMWQQGTRYMPITSATKGNNFVRVAANWLKRLHDWYVIAPMELSGTLSTTRIFPEIRIGHRVKEKREEGTIDYYVEGVSHSWTFGQAGRTSLTVTRGEYEDDHLLERVYAELGRGFSANRLCSDTDDPDAILAELASGCAHRSTTVDGAAMTQSGVDVPDFTAEGHAADADPNALLGQVPTDAPSEAAAQRAYHGLPEPTSTVNEQSTPQFDRDALESGAPIPSPEPFDTDPLAGLSEEDLSSP